MNAQEISKDALIRYGFLSLLRYYVSLGELFNY